MLFLDSDRPLLFCQGSIRHRLNLFLPCWSGVALWKLSLFGKGAAEAIFIEIFEWSELNGCLGWVLVRQILLIGHLAEARTWDGGLGLLLLSHFKKACDFRFRQIITWSLSSISLWGIFAVSEILLEYSAANGWPLTRIGPLNFSKEIDGQLSSVEFYGDQRQGILVGEAVGWIRCRAI